MSMEPKGAINWFVCPVCDGLTVTINQDIGTTPDTLECRATGKVGDCVGWASSSFYPSVPLPEGRLYAVWAWYRPPSGTPVPDQKTLAFLNAGGLLLRPVVLTDGLRSKLAKVRARNPERPLAPSLYLPDPKQFVPDRRRLLR